MNYPEAPQIPDFPELVYDYVTIKYDTIIDVAKTDLSEYTHIEVASVHPSDLGGECSCCTPRHTDKGEISLRCYRPITDLDIVEQYEHFYQSLRKYYETYIIISNGDDIWAAMRWFNHFKDHNTYIAWYHRLSLAMLQT